MKQGLRCWESSAAWWLRVWVLESGCLDLNVAAASVLAEGPATVWTCVPSCVKLR